MVKPHRRWLIDNGLGAWASKQGPKFLDDNCRYDDNDETCNLCNHKVECDEYFEPLAKALERYYEIGEV